MTDLGHLPLVITISPMTPLMIRTLPIDQLIPAPYNPRKPLTKNAFAKLRKSLETFGLVEPLIWNERSGLIVGGHARLNILRDMGIQDVPVSVVHLDPERERALNIMLNNLEAQGRYDPESLRAILEPLSGSDTFELTGFDPSILKSLNLSPTDFAPLPIERDHVEVTLRMKPNVWIDVSPRVDAIVKEFELKVNVRE